MNKRAFLEGLQEALAGSDVLRTGLGGGLGVGAGFLLNELFNKEKHKALLPILGGLAGGLGGYASGPLFEAKEPGGEDLQGVPPTPPMPQEEQTKKFQEQLQLMQQAQKQLREKYGVTFGGSGYKYDRKPSEEERGMITNFIRRNLPAWAAVEHGKILRDIPSETKQGVDPILTLSNVWAKVLEALKGKIK